MNRGPLIAAVAAAIVAVAALGLYFLGGKSGAPTGSSDAVSDEQAAADSPSGDLRNDSPFAIQSDGDTQDASRDGSSSAAATASAREPVPSTIETGTRVAPLSGPVDVASLGLADIPDDQFDALVARLAIDPDLRAALIDEVRLETDPARLARRVALLGNVGGADVTALAAELAYSSDPAWQAQGLELLRHVQPGNEDARAIVSGLLATTTEPDTLLPTLQTLSRPGVVDNASRGELASQVALLSGHGDEKVRRLGLDILSRWSVANDHVPVLLDGLRDPDPGVRETAAYAFTRKPEAGSVAIEALLLVAADTTEVETVRRGAIRSLDGMEIDPVQRQRLDDLERELDRR